MTRLPLFDEFGRFDYSPAESLHIEKVRTAPMGDQLFFERFVWFDCEIRRGRFPNAAHLADYFEISPKTAQRSIEFFRDRLCVPLEYNYFKKGYRYTDPSFQLPITRISEEELLALLISQKLISEASAGCLGEELGRVAKRLGSLLTAHLPGKNHPEEAFSFRWKSVTRTDPQIFKIVTSALRQGRLLTFSYHPPSKDEGTTRTVEPHHMVNYMGNWHVIAFCHLRGDWRDFVLGRMGKCQIENTEFQFRSREEWQPLLQNTFGIFQNRARFDVILRFSPDRSRWVKEEVWHEGQADRLEDDGSLIRSIPASHETEILLEVLKHGAQVEVLEPKWLRDKVIDEMKATIIRYRA